MQHRIPAKLRLYTNSCFWGAFLHITCDVLQVCAVLDIPVEEDVLRAAERKAAAGGGGGGADDDASGSAMEDDASDDVSHTAQLSTIIMPANQTGISL